MKRLALLFLASSWAVAALGQGAPDRGPRKCLAGPSEPRDPPLPPQSVAICRYGPAEFQTRVDRLLAVRAGRLGSDEVERIFSLPPLTITHHDPRSTNLGVILRSVPGREWWSAVIYVREGFFGPKFNGPPVPLRGLRRPVPILPRKPGDILVSVVPLQMLDPLMPPPHRCLPVAALLDSARRHGWAKSPVSRPTSPHAPAGWRNVDLVRDGLTFSTSFRDEKDCVIDFSLSQPADPRPSRRPKPKLRRPA